MFFFLFTGELSLFIYIRYNQCVWSLGLKVISYKLYTHINYIYNCVYVHIVHTHCVCIHSEQIGK